MASKDNESKNVETKKKNSSSTKKSSTTKKTNTSMKDKGTSNTAKKSTTSKTNTNKKSSVTKSAKKTVTTKKTTAVKASTPKKSVSKKIDKDLEKTFIIEDLENKFINIVENKKVDIKEQVIEDIKIENSAKLENAKYKQIKKNKHLLAIGVIISLLGIIALIITLIANRIVDKEFISDNAIVLMVIASILIECFGAFIIINES